MKKLHDASIVLIIFCSSIVIGGIFYLFYRLYINHIYKRRRVWKDIISPMKNKSEEISIKHMDILMPRQSIIPLVQEFLPNDWKKQTERRKMITQLQFNEPPIFEKNFINEWEEMDNKNFISSSPFISTQSSYYTIQNETPTHQITKLDNEYLLKYFSMSSSFDQLLNSFLSKEQISSIGDNSHHESPLNLMEYSSKNLFNNTINNNSSNFIPINNFESLNRINKSNNLYNSYSIIV